MSALQRFRSKRDPRHGEKASKRHKLTADLQWLFAKDDKRKQKTVDDEEKKVHELSKRISKLGLKKMADSTIEQALRDNYSGGDVDKAYDLLVMAEDSADGILKDYDPEVKLLGAVNRKSVSCYLDSILFAMFARLHSFEVMLYHQFEDAPRQNLATLLRLWVNMLRSGKLITTDTTGLIQKAMFDCGWSEATSQRQQDASEAFSFITEKLQLPLLTLKMDIFHTGKESAEDDHKFVNERLLEVAIPSESAGDRPITLEDCLETYFNNRVEVKRYLERRGTNESLKAMEAFSGTKPIDIEKGGSTHIEVMDFGSAPNTPIADSPATSSLLESSLRPRGLSLIRERVVIEGIRPESDEFPPITMPRPRRRASSTKKEVLMPAWQFFSLIPWYTDNAPKTDAQVADHFSSVRPVLGICLKRYSVLPNGNAIRLNTHIDIPLEIGLPHFIRDDSLLDNAPLFGNFKLVLQSVVCHRGNSVHSGHYVSLVRGEKSRERALPDESNEGWLLFDDLAPERVKFVDIDKALKDELPYLLFYQVQPIDDDASSTDGSIPKLQVDGQVDSPRDLLRIPSFGPDSSKSGASESRRTSVVSVSEDPSTVKTSFELSSREISPLVEKSADDAKLDNVTVEQVVEALQSSEGIGTRQSRLSQFGAKIIGSRNGSRSRGTSQTRAGAGLSPNLRPVDALASPLESGTQGELSPLTAAEKEKVKKKISHHFTSPKGKKGVPDRECMVM